VTQGLSDGQEVSFYKHVNPWIHNVEARISGDGKYRIYFSADESPTGCRIYYLDHQKKPVPYHTYHGDDLVLPDPCFPGEPFWWSGWRGDFCFDDDKNLYLSTGATIPAGIFRVKNAGLDKVTGSPERIYWTFANSIEGLAYESPDTLYFISGSLTGEPKIFSLDLNTLKQTLVYASPYVTGDPQTSEAIYDVAVVPGLVSLVSGITTVQPPFEIHLPPP